MEPTTQRPTAHMNPLVRALRREVRVATSLKAQPLWFRIVKWIAILVFATAFHDRSWFWPVIGICSVVAFTVHFLYRWKTRVWTQSWGGWNDLEAGRG